MLLSSTGLIEANGQNISGCGLTDQYTEQEAEALPWFGNNQYLVDELQRLNISITSDYLRMVSDSSQTQAARPLSQAELQNSVVYTIPMKVWIYRNSNGTGGISRAGAIEKVSEINRFFHQQNIPIKFSLRCQIDEINNTRFYFRPDDNALNDMWIQNRDPQAINVHLVDSPTNWAGIAVLPRTNNGSLSQRRFSLALGHYWGNGVFAHEIGHTLGLLHTHDGGRSDKDWNDECGDCFQESVSRTRKQGLACVSTIGAYKSEVNGDFLRDTPADPGLLKNNIYRVSFGCTYPDINQQKGRDNWGREWEPDTRNIMSYTQLGCMTQITPLQAGIMLYWAQQVGIVSNGLAISGPTLLCNGQTGTYIVSGSSSGQTLQWRVPSGWTIVGQGSAQVRITAGAGTDRTVQVDASCATAPGFINVNSGLSAQNISVTGPAFPCPAKENICRTESLTGATYVWHAPPGWQIVNPTSSVTSINPPDAYTSGQVWVTVTACGAIADSPRLNVQVTEECYQTPPIYYPPGEATSRTGSNSSPELVRAFYAYPMPAADHMTILLSLQDAQKYDYTLLNSYGQVVVKGKCSATPQRIDVSRLPRGLYWMRIVGKNKSLTKQIELK